MAQHSATDELVGKVHLRHARALVLNFAGRQSGQFAQWNGIQLGPDRHRFRGKLLSNDGNCADFWGQPGGADKFGEVVEHTF